MRKKYIEIRNLLRELSGILQLISTDNAVLINYIKDLDARTIKLIGDLD